MHPFARVRNRIARVVNGDFPRRVNADLRWEGNVLLMDAPDELHAEPSRCGRALGVIMRSS